MEQQDIFSVIDSRASCRSFLDRDIPQPVLDRLLEAACKCPSSGGFQNYSLIVIRDPDKREALCRLSRNQPFVREAPVSILFCADYRNNYRLAMEEYAPRGPVISFSDLLMASVDAVLCAQTLCLAAEALGLRSCYNGNVDQSLDRLCELFELPKYTAPVILLSIGYPKEEPVISRKYPAALQVSYDVYREPSAEALTAAHAEKYPGNRIPCSERALEQFRSFSEGRYGPEWTQEALRRIEAAGGMTFLQRQLCCFYARRAGDMSSAEDYRAFYRGQGFDV